jgi:hypothetical protein
MFTGAKIFIKNYDTHSLSKKVVSIDKDLKKIISQITKLLKSKDYKLIDSGIDLLKSENNNTLYEYFLNGISIDSEGKFIYSKIFKGSRLTQPYYDYSLLQIIHNSPQKIDINDSIKHDNIYSISLGAEFYKKVFVFRIDGYVDQEDCGKFTSEKLFLSNLKNLKTFSLTNYINIESLGFLYNLKNLKSIELNNCTNISEDYLIKSFSHVDNVTLDGKKIIKDNKVFDKEIETLSPSNIMISKKFVIRKSLMGQNLIVSFTDQNGKNYEYNHDEIYHKNVQFFNDDKSFQINGYYSSDSFPRKLLN